MRRFLLLLLLITIPYLSHAQKSGVVVSVFDSKSLEPITGASVYTVSCIDSTVFNYSVNGNAVLTGVPTDKYLLVAEFLGYSKYQKEMCTSGNEVKSDTIFLGKISEGLLPAIIRASVKPVEFKRDSIIYDVSYFNVGHNYFLSDLLKSMPGVRVDGDKVSVNGKNVSKITFGGRTFFFDDLSMALNNIPADIIRRITVVDKPVNKFTGITGKREHILDVELKKEYQNGLFGNINAGLGVNPVKSEDGTSANYKDLLYSGKALISAYNDKDQFTVIGNANNFKEENPRKQGEGLSSLQQAAANYNTSRIKGIETTVVSSYKHSLSEFESKKQRESFEINRSHLRTTDSRNTGSDNKETAIVVQADNTSRETFYFSLKENLSISDKEQHEESSTRNDDTPHSVNTTSKETAGLKRLASQTNFTVGYNSSRREGRSFLIDGVFGYYTESADSWFENSSPVLNYSYNISDKKISTFLNAKYVEPINSKMKVITSVEYMNTAEKESRSAYGNPGLGSSIYKDGRFSSSIDSRSRLLHETVGLQYNKKKNSIQAGANIFHTLNENLYDIRADAAGKEKWSLYCSPYANIRYNIGRSKIQFTCSSHIEQPLQYQLRPSIDIEKFPVVTIGNVYLRPSLHRSALLYFTLNSSKDWEYVSIWGELSAVSNAIVNVTWFDDEGTSYQIPVNAESPTRSARLDINWSKPLTNNLTLDAFARCAYYGKEYYQRKSSFQADIIENFDYSGFMEQFWGSGLSGDLFHSENSMFSQSRMGIIKSTASVSLSYEGEHFRFNCEEYACNTRSRHSGPMENGSIWDYLTILETVWKSNAGLEIIADSYNYFYSGYPEGFGKPRYIIDFTLNKKLKHFVLGVKVNNLLNQNTLLKYAIEGNYTESVNSNCLGRYILLSVRYSFGNANQSRRKRANEAFQPIR